MKKFLLIFTLLFSVNLSAQEQPATGTIINSKNIDQYNTYVDQPLAELIKQKYLSILVGDSFFLPTNANFLLQTEKYKGTASINKTTGQLVNYQEGLPFVIEPSMDDPSAGLKIAWNMRYTYGGDSSMVDPFIWDYHNMKKDKIDRILSFVGKMLRYKHRVMSLDNTELSNNSVGIFNAIYLLAKEPYDIKNTQLLVHRLEDDTAREKTWLYLSVQRRVRRLPSGQSTDSFLGSDIMIEDFLGYNGRIKDMEWKYLGTENLLMPIFKYDEITLDNKIDKTGFSFGQFHGKGHCFPNVPWQLRKVYKVEAIPKWNQHPLSKRIFYVDAQTYIPVLGRYYDRTGNIWRLAIGAFSDPNHHIASNKGSGVAIPSLISMIDIQAQHCTTLKMKTFINSEKVSRKDFTVQSLRTKGK